MRVFDTKSDYNTHHKESILVCGATPSFVSKMLGILDANYFQCINVFTAYNVDDFHASMNQLGKVALCIFDGDIDKNYNIKTVQENHPETIWVIIAEKNKTYLTWLGQEILNNPDNALLIKPAKKNCLNAVVCNALCNIRDEGCPTRARGKTWLQLLFSIG